ncbi:MAG: acetylesterase [Oscillospiraceae bacterium]|jgi:S-formylglutathione hydrolase FrmB|nr:acetylesterase [Oscillospiraceae bacterium]
MRLTGTLYSKVLQMDTGITVVTPNKAERLQQPAKVAYLLHGAGGNSRTWLDYSLLPVYASRGNTIYILPEAGRSFYADMRHGQKFASYLCEELPEFCRRVFQISAAPEDTAVMGCSMGGYAALRSALQYPERFGLCAAFSTGPLFLLETLTRLQEPSFCAAFVAQFGQQLLDDFGAIFGSALQAEQTQDLTVLAQQAVGRAPQLFLTCGRQDAFYAEHLRFCALLEKLGIAHTFESWDAGHTFPCFNDALKRAIDHFSL